VDEQSFWKKEISFKRKPKEKRIATEPAGESAAAQAATSVWKKEITFRRRPKVEQHPPAAEVTTAPPVEPPPVDEVPQPAPPPVVGPEPQLAAPVIPPPAVAPVAPAPPVAAAPPAVESAPPAELEPEPLPAAPPPPPVVEAPPPPADLVPPPVDLPSPPPTIAPEPAPEPAAVHAPDPEPLLATAGVAEKPVPFWKREVVLGRRGPAKPKAKPKAEQEPKAKSAPKKPKRTKATKVERGRGGKGKKVVGLKVGASQLAAARIANDASAELLQVAREPLSPGIVVGGELRDPDALAHALKDFFAKNKLPKRGVRLGIANNRIGVRTFDVAGITDEKQLDNAIRFRAQETLPIPIDEAVLDYHVLGETTTEEGEAARRILLVVAYREQIDRYVDACKKAGITLSGIDLEAFALLRALQAPQSGAGGDPSAALVAVAIGHERSTFAVSDGRVCEFTRVLEWGGAALNVALARALDAAPSEVEAIKRALSLTDDTVPEGLSPEQFAKGRDSIRRAIQAFARELVSSLQFYQNQPGSLGIGEIVLTGGTTHLVGLAEELEQLIGVRVRVGDPLARIKVSKRVGEPEQVGSLAVAIGLGIED
jgi:type IV pilus assembly protein PilM